MSKPSFLVILMLGPRLCSDSPFFRRCALKWPAIQVPWPMSQEGAWPVVPWAPGGEPFSYVLHAIGPVVKSGVKEVHERMDGHYISSEVRLVGGENSACRDFSSASSFTITKYSEVKFLLRKLPKFLISRVPFHCCRYQERKHWLCLRADTRGKRSVYSWRGP